MHLCDKIPGGSDWSPGALLEFYRKEFSFSWILVFVPNAR